MNKTSSVKIPPIYDTSRSLVLCIFIEVCVASENTNYASSVIEFNLLSKNPHGGLDLNFTIAPSCAVSNQLQRDDPRYYSV